MWLKGNITGHSQHEGDDFTSKTYDKPGLSLYFKWFTPGKKIHHGEILKVVFSQYR